MKKLNLLFTALLLMLFVGTAKAEEVTIDGIKYNVITKAKLATVVRDNYSGDIVIPSEITYNNATYSVTSIENEAFCDCHALTSITIPNSVTSIGNHAFSWCYSLTSITIPNSVTSIGKHAFNACKGLKNITISNSLTSIGSFAFAYCNDLTNITIPNSVTSIGSSVFSGCSSLTSITIGNGVTSIDDYTFDGCSSLTSITIGSRVTSIGNYAFRYCSSLTNITIPNSVINIKTCAFQDCDGLKSITIPDGVISIRDYAFCDCDGLTDVYCLATNVPATSSDAFNGSYPEYMTLHVPAEAINSYKTTAPWSTFGTIVEIANTDIINIPVKAMLVTSNNGTININCALEGEVVELYTSDAMYIGSTTIENGTATIESGLSKGDIAIIKIAEKSIKVILN